MSMDFLSNLVITKVHSVSTLYNPKNKKMKRNDRPQWAIVIKYEGETVYTSNGKHFLSDIGHVVILPRGCSYDWECTKSGHFCIIEFESEHNYSEPISFSVKNGEKILKMFKDLEHKRNMENPMAEMESIRDTYSILLALIQAITKRYSHSKKQQKIAPAIKYISQNQYTRILYS